MRSFIIGLFAVACFAVVGCSDGQPDPVATTEDEFAAYDAMMAEAEAETEADEAAEVEE